MKNKYVTLTALTLFISGSAMAGGAGGMGHGGYAQHYGHGGYIGLGLGRTDNNIGTRNLTTPNACNIPGSNCSFDDQDKAWQVFGGYQFSPHFGVEGAYVDLGKTADVSDGFGTRGIQETKGVSLSAVGKVPLSGAASLYGKAGVFHWDSDARIGGNNVSDRGTEPTIGVGIEYKMPHQWTSRLGWDRYYNVGEKDAFLSATGADTVETDVDVYSVGLYYNF